MVDFTFDAETVDPGSEYVPLPPGDYLVQIITDEYKANSTGTGHYLKIEHEIMDGEHQGRKLFNNLNLDNPNADTVKIAQQTLSQICHATGMMSIRKTDELHFKPMIASVGVTPPKGNYGAGNSIKRYKSADGSVPQSSAPRAAAPQAPKPAAPAAKRPWAR